MASVPPVQYVTSGGLDIGYQIVGEGSPNVLFLRGPFNHLDLQWEEPRFARFLRGLASFARVVTYDLRGFGVSDRTTFSSPGLPLEIWADDAIAVLDATGCDRAAIVAAGGAARRAVVFAATHPERISALVLCNGTVMTPGTGAPLPGASPHPSPTMTWDEADRNAVASYVRSHFGRATGRSDFDPDWSERFREWVARYERSSASPRTAAGFAAVATRGGDVRHILGAVRVPALAIANELAEPSFLAWQERSASAALSVDHARLIAASIDGAELRILPGEAHMNGWLFDDPEAVTDEIERFLVGQRPTQRTDRVLATVLFTDIVDSTRRASELGDARWRRVLDQLDETVGAEVGRFGGRVIKQTGDGHLATFDLPGRAIACASSLLELAKTDLGLHMRSGVHTGEIELRGSDVAGMAVVIGRRVCDIAKPGSVLASAAVPPLVTGSRLTFTDAGSHELKGVPGPWQLYEVEA